MRILVISATAVLFILTPAIITAEEPPCDFKLESDGFMICHDERYLQDAEFAKGVLDKATPRFRSRYGVRGTFTTIWLFGKRTEVDCGGRAFVIMPGLALNCGGDRIYLMSRSSPEMNTCCTQLGLHFQSDEYWITLLNHEYSTGFQDDFPGFYSKPRWFYDGLEQYEGYFATNSPDVWRRAATKTYDDNAITCGGGLRGDTLAITEPYAAGATYFGYLADRFGEKIHIDMIRDLRSDAAQILAELIDESPCETFDHFRNWMFEKYGLGSPVPVSALPTAAAVLMSFALTVLGAIRRWRV